MPDDTKLTNRDLEELRLLCWALATAEHDGLVCQPATCSAQYVLHTSLLKRWHSRVGFVTKAKRQIEVL
jgi:hypothetical protein